MAKLTKRQQLIAEKVDVAKVYSFEEAVSLLTEVSKVKFTESFEVAVNLGVDPRKSDQVVRGATVLPNGTGKDVRVAVFAQGDNAEKAKAAGADVVGFDDLAAEIKGGRLDFDVVIATPDAMRVVGTLGTVLGPRGLMPNPKVGTVTFDVGPVVQSIKAGQVEFRVDKVGNMHAPVGKLSFDPEKLRENVVAFVDAVNRLKPSTSKGIYMRNCSVSSTMGPGLRIDLQTVR